MSTFKKEYLTVYSWEISLIDKENNNIKITTIDAENIIKLMEDFINMSIEEEYEIIKVERRKLKSFAII